MKNTTIMNNLLKITLIVLVLFGSTLSAQNVPPACPTTSIYAQQGNSIRAYPQPNGPFTTVINNMPGAAGLAVGPAFSFPAPNPTWWTLSGGTYWYFNNTGTWSNTGHTAGNGAAVNIGGGGSCLYNLVGANGGVYRYNGTGNGVLVANILPAFSGGGPYDIVADMADNFYILKTNSPGQGLYAYNPQGVLTCSWTGVGMINQSAGCGFSILNTNNPSIHRAYYDANGTDYVGNILPGVSTINFTAIPVPQASCDYASCALSVPYGSVTAGPGGGTLTCTNPQVTLIASIFGNNSLNWLPAYPTNTAAAQNPTCGGIQWEGPGPNTTVGIVSGQGTPTIVVNQPGVYSFTWTGCNGCPGYSVTASYTVVGQGATIIPVITAPTCISSPTQISVTPNSATNTIQWAGPSIVGPSNTPTITISGAGIYSVSISIPNSACAGTGTVLINPTPTISIAASSLSMCANNYNNSLNSVTLTGSGATNYTWSSVGLVQTSASNTNATITYTPQANNIIGVATLIGSNGTCSASATASIVIIDNPLITVTSASMCAGNTLAIVANGANSYNWSPATNLNATTGATVVSNTPSTTIYNVIGSSNGCNSQTQSSTVTVVPNPTITVTPLTNTICAGGNLTLTAAGATNYTWSPAATLNTSNGPVVVASPMNTTNYIVIGEAGTCTASAMYQVSVIAVPNIQVTSSHYTICQNQGALITANGADNYNWSPAIGLNTTQGNQVNAHPLTTTVYHVTGNNGVCIATGSLTINVVQLPLLVLTTPNNKICQGTSTSIFASGATNYSWSPLTGLSNMQNPTMVTASPNVSTNYTVTGSNSLGSVTCPFTKEILIEVVPNVTASVTNSVAICKGQSTRIIAYGGNTYMWLPNQGLSASDASDIYVTPQSTTIYTAYVSNSGNCGATATVLVKVNPIPDINAGEDFVSNLDEAMYLKATSNGTLTWVSGEGVLCATCPNTQIMAKKSGCYLAETVNSFGCKSRDEVCVEVTTDYNIYIPNVFTPNGDGNNDVFLVYGTGITKLEMTIFDRWGEKLFNSKDQLQGWDGMYKGVLSKQDAYTYLVTYTSLDGKKHEKTGHVTLLK
jgi:gliding motility-associated-like protein